MFRSTSGPPAPPFILDSTYAFETQSKKLLTISHPVVSPSTPTKPPSSTLSSKPLKGSTLRPSTLNAFKTAFSRLKYRLFRHPLAVFQQSTRSLARTPGDGCLEFVPPPPSSSPCAQTPTPYRLYLQTLPSR